jgi:hypothetical protein
MVQVFNITVCYQNINPTLVLEVLSNIYPESTTRCLYTVPLADLIQCETLLNDGRFLNYERTPQPITVDEVKETYQPAAIQYFTTRLDWIASNIYNPWSVQMKMRHVGCAVFTWSFEKESDALLYKLTF